MKINPLPKLVAARNVMLHLNQRQHFLDLASELRAMVSDQSGNCGGINPYPISGGICGHWSDEQKDAIIECVQAANQATDQALACHKRAGRRTATFRDLLSKTI